MKKLILALCMLFIMASNGFALTNDNVEAKLKLYDAATGGPVTDSTTTVTIFATVKAELPNDENPIPLMAAISLIKIVDFDGNVILEASTPIKFVPVSEFFGMSIFHGHGETSIRFGNIKLLNSKGKYIRPRKGLMVNAYIELDPAYGGNFTYSMSRATEIIEFNRK